MLENIVLLSMLLWIHPWMSAQNNLNFTDVTEASGIDHQFQVYEGMFGGGICVFDYNNDGFEDLYLTSGVNDDQLYRNNGDGTFSNVFEGSGLELTRNYATQGVSSADINRDGYRDLLITTITSRGAKKKIPREKNLLFLNNGEGKFVDATEAYRLDELHSFSTGASFGDFNLDGYPDLYVGNYFHDYDGPLTEINDATIVNASRTAKDYLLLNVKGKYFKNVYEDYGLDHKGFGFGGLFTDFDNDGDQDILVNNDFGYKAEPNYLLRNDYPKASFTYVEDEHDMDLRINAMAAAVGDYDNNGFLDYFVTNIKFNFFMVNQGGEEMMFKNLTKPSGMSYFTISWGANFADFDHDGDLDLYVVNGDLNPNCVPMANFLFENEDGHFTDQARLSGTNDYGMGRGSVVFDIENDGDLDILFINQKPIKDYPVESTSRLYRNDLKAGNWLKVKLIGGHSETMGLGAKVEVVTKSDRMIREIDGGSSSHLSQNSSIAHFGLGQSEIVDSVIVHWGGEKKQVVVNQKANEVLTVRQPKEKRRLNLSMLWILLIIPFLFLFWKYRK